MSIRIRSGSLLARYTDHKEVIEVEGKTIMESLRNLVAAFPQLKLFDDKGKLLDFYGIYLNNKQVLPKEMAAPVRDGDEIVIVVMVEGG
ncbi:MoaD/ThiS family protein [Chloroflexota bacterium]